MYRYMVLPTDFSFDTFLSLPCGHLHAIRVFFEQRKNNRVIIHTLVFHSVGLYRITTAVMVRTTGKCFNICQILSPDVSLFLSHTILYTYIYCTPIQRFHPLKRSYVYCGRSPCSSYYYYWNDWALAIQFASIYICIVCSPWKH